MEAIFIHNGQIYRIDGKSDKSCCFWGERLEMGADGLVEYTEDYQEFDLSDLITAQSEAILQALTQTVDED